ncbi:FYVE zinc finger-domain-containing protein [Rhizoctonia solani]|nr:FYVE zinc finger-domain-containing protein [Rhizoctonia solani]
MADTQAPSPTPDQATSSESSSQPGSPLTQLPALPVSRPGSETAGPSSAGPSSPTSSTAPSPRPTISQRPGSRFRVVSTRGPNASTQPARPSPLRPSGLSPGASTPAVPTHVRSLSNASTPASPSPVARIPTSASVPLALNERLSPANRNKPLPAVASPPSLTPPRSNTPTAAPPRSTTPVFAPPVVVAPIPTSNTPVPYAVLSRASSASPISSATPGANTPSRPAPYRAGFQPKGVYRHRTDEFEAARAKRIDGKRTEEKRLTRRLEKLIDLHFSPKEKDTPPPPNRRASSFFDLDLADLKSKSANELWRGVVESKAAQQERAIRTAEQSITKWEDDKDVSACPICVTSFHPLTNRKHHCRLCGRIVCSLPPKPPTRPVSCSLLIVADPRTGKIDEVPDVIAYGVTLDGEKDSKYVKGVRICRTCRAVVAKQQYNIETTTVPAFSRIYQALLRLEGQIEDDLPQFQELVLNLKNGTHSNVSTSTTAAARKSLLDRFHEYDRLAKRLRALPCQPGSSQERVQIAVATRASVFLQKHMFPLQTLPKMKQLAKAATESEAVEPLPALDDLGHTIQPLLEQEAVLEQMLSEAQAARKIEDALTLKSNLTEIRNEIRRLVG